MEFSWKRRSGMFQTSPAHFSANSHSVLQCHYKSPRTNTGFLPLYEYLTKGMRERELDTCHPVLVLLKGTWKITSGHCFLKQAGNQENAEMKKQSLKALFLYRKGQHKSLRNQQGFSLVLFDPSFEWASHIKSFKDILQIKNYVSCIIHSINWLV